jgi:hypothetical protein
MNDRRALAVRLLPLVLVLALAGAWLVPATDAVELAGDRAAADGFGAALDALPEAASVLVGFDADLGTYAEIRPTVRTALADLLARNARLIVVSLTPEGRALALAELQRLARYEANPTRILDLGYLTGAEAALVALARQPVVPSTASGELADGLRAEGIGAVDAVMVVGGNDLGPRTWVEQLQPRIERVPFLAIAPATLLPELQPYVAGGQLAGLLGTPRDGAAYRATASLGTLGRIAEADAPPALPILVGMLVAIAVLGQAWLARAGTAFATPGREGRE